MVTTLTTIFAVFVLPSILIKIAPFEWIPAVRGAIFGEAQVESHSLRHYIFCLDPILKSLASFFPLFAKLKRTRADLLSSTSIIRRGRL